MKKLTKNTYSKPLLEVIKVDHEISLVMQSIPVNPDDPWATAAPSENPTPMFPGESGGSTNNVDPFGGDAPDYK